MRNIYEKKNINKKTSKYILNTLVSNAKIHC